MSLKCYTYEVKIVVNVLAENEEAATEQIEKQAGIVYSSENKLVKVTDLID